MIKNNIESWLELVLDGYPPQILSSLKGKKSSLDNIKLQAFKTFENQIEIDECSSKQFSSS